MKDRIKLYEKAIQELNEAKMQLIEKTIKTQIVIEAGLLTIAALCIMFLSIV